MDLPPDVQRWCMALQPQFKSHNTNEVPKLLQTVSGEEPPFGDRPPAVRALAEVGNCGQIGGAQLYPGDESAPTVGFEQMLAAEPPPPHVPCECQEPALRRQLCAGALRARDLPQSPALCPRADPPPVPVRSFLPVDRERVRTYSLAFRCIHDRGAERHAVPFRWAACVVG